MAARMSELRTARPWSVNGGTTTTSKPRSLPSAASASGVPRRSKPNAASGVMSNPASEVPRLDRGDERVVWRPSHGVVEMLDDGDPHARRGQPLEALIRVDQQRRRRPGQDLIRMRIECDHGRTGRSCLGPPDQVLQQVGMAAMETIEHADDREDRAVLRAKALDPGDDLHQAGTTDSAGATSTLSGARRPPGASMAIAARRPSGARSR